MSWTIEVLPEADGDLRSRRLFEQRRIADAIIGQLTYEPDVVTRNRKCLGAHVTANFDFVPPLWELRVGEYRVFYSMDWVARLVLVHAVRFKPATKSTQEVLSEDDDG